VREALDRILQREDVSVTPLERRRFVAGGVGHPRLRPARPAAGRRDITEVMCNAFDDIWVEREGRIERTDLSFTDDAQYRQVIDKIVSRWAGASTSPPPWSTPACPTAPA
jgi:pilus assembly protein CpaF